MDARTLTHFPFPTLPEPPLSALFFLSHLPLPRSPRRSSMAPTAFVPGAASAVFSHARLGTSCVCTSRAPAALPVLGRARLLASAADEFDSTKDRAAASVKDAVDDSSSAGDAAFNVAEKSGDAAQEVHDAVMEKSHEADVAAGSGVRSIGDALQDAVQSDKETYEKLVGGVGVVSDDPAQATSDMAASTSESVQEVTADVKESAADTAGTVNSSVADTTDDVKAAASDAADDASSLVDDVKEGLASAGKEVERFVHGSAASEGGKMSADVKEVMEEVGVEGATLVDAAEGTVTGAKNAAAGAKKTLEVVGRDAKDALEDKE